MATGPVRLGFTRAATDINEYLEWAKLAERVGADVIGFGDGQELWNELYVSLSLLAATTTTPLIGATVSNPVTRSRYMSRSVLPHLKTVPLVKSNGLIGFPLLSVREAAEGPPPRPSFPWQLPQFIFWKSSDPRWMLSVEDGGSGGISTGAPGFSS